MSFEKYLADGFADIGIKLNGEQIDKFSRYKELLVSWNEKINLTAITDDRGVAIKHFVDSAALLSNIGEDIPEGSSFIDVGTGAGFPGIVLKIIRPDLDITLLDSLNKRVSFLNEVCESLGLSGIRAEHYRAEDAGQSEKFRQKYDFATARAVASMSVLSEYCTPFVKKGGYFLAMKGPDLEDELKGASKALKELGCEVSRVISFGIDMPAGENGEEAERLERGIAVIRKVSDTKPKYPRKAGTPAKKPL